MTQFLDLSYYQQGGWADTKMYFKQMISKEGPFKSLSNSLKKMINKSNWL